MQRDAPPSVGLVLQKQRIGARGWYYDIDPATGKPPTAILTCPATCAEFRKDGAARVDIVLGCPTIVIV